MSEFLAIERIVKEGEDDTVGTVFVETDPTTIARNMAGGLTIDYYQINLNPGTLLASIRPVRLKGGPRAVGRGREIAEIESGGSVVGSAEVNV